MSDVTFEEAQAALNTFREWEAKSSDIDGMWFVLKSDRERSGGATYSLEASGLDYIAMRGLALYELDNRIRTLRLWFPSAEFTVKVEDVT